MVPLFSLTQNPRNISFHAFLISCPFQCLLEPGLPLGLCFLPFFFSPFIFILFRPLCSGKSPREGSRQSWVWGSGFSACPLWLLRSYFFEPCSFHICKWEQGTYFLGTVVRINGIHIGVNAPSAPRLFKWPPSCCTLKRN